MLARYTCSIRSQWNGIVVNPTDASTVNDPRSPVSRMTQNAATATAGKDRAKTMFMPRNGLPVTPVTRPARPFCTRSAVG